MSERVQKLLAAAGVASRREIERWIRDGRLTINGNVAEPGNPVSGTERFALDGRPLSVKERRESHRHIIYNKPSETSVYMFISELLIPPIAILNGR